MHVFAPPVTASASDSASNVENLCLINVYIVIIIVVVLLVVVVAAEQQFCYTDVLFLNCKVHSVLEKSFKMLEIRIKNSRLLKVLESR